MCVWLCARRRTWGGGEPSEKGGRKEANKRGKRKEASKEEEERMAVKIWR